MIIVTQKSEGKPFKVKGSLLVEGIKISVCGDYSTLHITWKDSTFVFQHKTKEEFCENIKAIRIAIRHEQKRLLILAKARAQEING